MRISKLVAIATVWMASLFAVNHSWAVDPEPEPNDLDPVIVAKMERLKHKRIGDQDGSSTVRVNADSLGNFAQCGSLNIGNVVAPQQRLGQQPREINVIITGSVVNANNKCK